jgi:hypothetical protein
MDQPTPSLDFSQNQERFRTITEPRSTSTPIPAALANWLAKIAPRLKAAKTKTTEEAYDPTP